MLMLWEVPGLPEIEAGADLATLIWQATQADRALQDGDVLAVASKIVAKAEDRGVPAEQREAAITAESVRQVAARSLPHGRVTQVVQAAAGPVMAAAGVDTSDVPAGTVLLLPADPDASARRIRAGLGGRGVDVGVLVTDTGGRPWRAGVADFALGAAGIACLDDRRGTPDAHGRPLSVTVRAVADELAAAADLVKGKSAGTPVAVLRGLPTGTVTAGDGPGGRALVRSGATDWFRTGHVEAVWAALAPRETPQPPAIDPFTEPVADRVRRAVGVALAPRRGEPEPQATADVTGTRVRFEGPPYAVGRAVERLLTAAWAEDLGADADPVTATVHLREVRPVTAPAAASQIPDPGRGKG